MAFLATTEVRAGVPSIPVPIATVSPSSDWVTVRPAGKVNSADNSGSTILNPAAIPLASAYRLKVGGYGTYVLLRLSYKSSALTTAPVIQVFGIDVNDVPMRLHDSTGAHELTLSADATNDIDDGTDSYTDYKLIDCKGNAHIVVGVKTAGAGGAAATATIDARVV